MRILFFFIWSSFLLSFGVEAQPISSWPRSYPGRELNNPAYKALVNLRLEEASLTLPFYDDFTYNAAVSYYTFWEDSAAIKSITPLYSQSVAKSAFLLDGLHADGSRYDSSDFYTSKLETDSLVSNPLNLSGYSASTTITLGFAWQGTGTVRPDSAQGDALVLMMKGKQTAWETLWTSPLRFDSSLFYTQQIQINSSFFQDSVQIKFVRFGNSTELADSLSTVWYITKITISPSLTLPIWEDFSNPSTFATKFKTNTGIYVNNSYAINEPSVYVASFDGLDDVGRPYSSTSPYKYGPADSLVSLSINLDTITQTLHPSDSLYISFYYENSGSGESPDRVEGDTLVLKLFDNQGIWRTVWQVKIMDTVVVDTFFQVLYKIVDPVFFHKDFKFKFQNYAKISGAWDVWHVDYVVLDTVLNASSSYTHQVYDGKMYFPDKALCDKPNSIIEPYYSIPSFHLDSFPFSDTLKFTARNFSNGPQFFDIYYSISILQETQLVIDTLPTFVHFAIDPNSVDSKHYILINKDSLSRIKKILPTSKPFDIITNVYIGADPDTNIRSFLFRQNDTVRVTNTFSDYYSYDDGSYERTLYNQSPNTSHALQYTSLKSDTLTHIDISFPYDGYNISGATMTLKVWNDNKGIPGDEIMSLSRTAQYSQGRNPFTRYQIDSTIVNGTFYIGLIQDAGNSGALRIGMDLNHDAKQFYFYSTDMYPEWTQLDNVKGAIMMRPVFRGGSLSLTNGSTVISNDRQEEDAWVQLRIYPNPSLNGSATLSTVFDRVEITDLNGYLLQTSYATDNVNVSSFKQGMYLVRTYLKGRRQVGKLLYQQ